MPKYICGATSDIGVGREQQEDFVQFCEFDEETLLCIVADGTGSMPQRPQPASIVAMDIIENIKDSFGKKPDLLIKYPKFFLEKAMNDANRILGAFQMGNEELFSGYSASVTCCLFLPDRKIAIGHSGNTRLYIIRNGKVNLITHDHTQAYELLQEGKIDSETYYVHDGRLKLRGRFMKSTRILPSVLIIATVLQTSNVYALNQEASANVSSVDSTEIARTLQTLKADYMDTIVDTDDFQSMYQQVQNQMASTEQLDLAEYYAQNYEITFPTENLYDLSDVDIASGYDSSATNAQYISLASQCMNTYSDYVDASGQSGNSMQLFQSQFGDVTKELSLSTPTLPEGYDMSHLVSSAASNVSDIYKDALSSSGVSSVKDSINTQWIFQKAASGPDAYSIQSYSKLGKMNSGGQEAQKTQKDLFDKATEANQNIYNNLNTDLTQKTQKELLKIVDTDSSVLFAGSDKQAAKNQLKQIKQATNASGKITRKVNAITDAASDSWNRLKNNVTAKSEDEIKEALQSNVEANKKDKWGLCGKKSITGFIN